MLAWSQSPRAENACLIESQQTTTMLQLDVDAFDTQDVSESACLQGLGPGSRVGSAGPRKVCDYNTHRTRVKFAGHLPFRKSRRILPSEEKLVDISREAP